MDKTNTIKFVRPDEMADLIGVKSKQMVRWARLNYIPKLVLPNGRFVFNPEAVIQALRIQSERMTINA
jgi:predicted site-specific integrase-resolvase